MKKPKLKIIEKILNKIIVSLIIFIALVMGVSIFNFPGGFKLYTVQSGSMEPAIKTGSVVITQPTNEYKKGEIITYKSENERNNPKPQVTTTHRIVKAEKNEEGITYTTKGDANSSTDGNSLDKDLILGKVIFTLPLIGYLVAFSRTQVGLITLIVIPSTIIVYNEFLNIKKETKKLMEKRRKIKNANNVQEKIYDLFNKLEKEKYKKT